MKRLKYIFASLAVAAMVSACSNNLEKVSVDTTQVTAPAFEEFAGSKAIVVTEDNQATGVTVAWDKANFGYSAAVTYTLEASIPSGDSVKVVVMATSNEPEATISYETINKAVLSAGAVAGSETSLSLSLLASVSSAYKTLSSTTPLDFTVTPYKVSYPANLYMAGGFTVDAWNPGASPKLFITNEDNGEYQGLLNVDNDGFEFKFLGQADWSPIQYGTQLDPLVEVDAGNIADLKGKAAFYLMHVSLKNLKATPKLLSSISLVGGATDIGWDPATSLPFAPKAAAGADSYVWVIKDVNLKADGFKILFNNSWDNALGANGGSEEFVFGGGDAKFGTSGTYDIELDMSVYPYKATFTKK